MIWVLRKVTPTENLLSKKIFEEILVLILALVRRWMSALKSSLLSLDLFTRRFQGKIRNFCRVLCVPLLLGPGTFNVESLQRETRFVLCPYVTVLSASLVFLAYSSLHTCAWFRYKSGPQRPLVAQRETYRFQRWCRHWVAFNHVAVKTQSVVLTWNVV